MPAGEGSGRDEAPVVLEVALRGLLSGKTRITKHTTTAERDSIPRSSDALPSTIKSNVCSAP